LVLFLISGRKLNVIFTIYIRLVREIMSLSGSFMSPRILLLKPWQTSTSPTPRQKWQGGEHCARYHIQCKLQVHTLVVYQIIVNSFLLFLSFFCFCDTLNKHKMKVIFCARKYLLSVETVFHFHRLVRQIVKILIYFHFDFSEYEVLLGINARRLITKLGRPIMPG